jgi:hypothetical protein
MSASMSASVNPWGLLSACAASATTALHLGPSQRSTRIGAAQDFAVTFIVSMNSERWGGHGGCGLELATPDDISGNSAGGILPFRLIAARDRFGEIESGAALT